MAVTSVGVVNVTHSMYILLTHSQVNELQTIAGLLFFHASVANHDYNILHTVRTSIGISSRSS